MLNWNRTPPQRMGRSVQLDEIGLAGLWGDGGFCVGRRLAQCRGGMVREEGLPNGWVGESAKQALHPSRGKLLVKCLILFIFAYLSVHLSADWRPGAFVDGLGFSVAKSAEAARCFDSSAECRVGEFALGVAKTGRRVLSTTIADYAPLCEDKFSQLASSEDRVLYPEFQASLFADGGRGCRLLCGPSRACSRVEKCSKTCQRSQVAYHCKSAKEREKKEAICRETLQCSVFGVKPEQLSLQEKQRYFYGLLSEVTQSPTFKKAWPSLNRRTDLAAHFLCVNLKKENSSLEILNVNDTHCSSTALGFGQVVNSTFLGTLGLSKKTYEFSKNTKLADICKKPQPRVRGEVWCPSEGNETIGDVFENSTFQPRQQVKGMVAAFLNHYRAAGQNWDRAWRDYYGVGQSGGVWTAQQRRRIDECVQQVRLSGYAAPSGRGSRQ